MRTRDDIEAFLTQSGYVHEEVAEGTWLVQDPAASERIVVRLEQDLVLYRLKVLELGDNQIQESCIAGLGEAFGERLQGSGQRETD